MHIQSDPLFPRNVSVAIHSPPSFKKGSHFKAQNAATSVFAKPSQNGEVISSLSDKNINILITKEIKSEEVKMSGFKDLEPFKKEKYSLVEARDLETLHGVTDWLDKALASGLAGQIFPLSENCNQAWENVKMIEKEKENLNQLEKERRGLKEELSQVSVFQNASLVFKKVFKMELSEIEKQILKKQEGLETVIEKMNEAKVIIHHTVFDKRGGLKARLEFLNKEKEVFEKFCKDFFKEVDKEEALNQTFGLQNEHTEQAKTYLFKEKFKKFTERFEEQFPGKVLQQKQKENYTHQSEEQKWQKKQDLETKKSELEEKLKEKFFLNGIDRLFYETQLLDCKQNLESLKAVLSKRPLEKKIIERNNLQENFRIGRGENSSLQKLKDEIAFLERENEAFSRLLLEKLSIKTLEEALFNVYQNKERVEEKLGKMKALFQKTPKFKTSLLSLDGGFKNNLNMVVDLIKIQNEEDRITLKTELLRQEVFLDSKEIPSEISNVLNDNQYKIANALEFRNTIIEKKQKNKKDSLASASLLAFDKETKIAKSLQSVELTQRPWIPLFKRLKEEGEEGQLVLYSLQQKLTNRIDSDKKRLEELKSFNLKKETQLAEIEQLFNAQKRDDFSVPSDNLKKSFQNLKLNENVDLNKIENHVQLKEIYQLAYQKHLNELIEEEELAGNIKELEQILKEMN